MHTTGPIGPCRVPGTSIQGVDCTSVEALILVRSIVWDSGGTPRNMKIKNRLAALLGAGVLVLGMAGTALAATGPSDAGITPTLHDGANITLDGNGNTDQADCDAADGIETGDTGGSDTTDNGVTVTWTYDAGTKEFGFSATGGLVTHAYVKGGNAYNDYDYTGEIGGGIASDGGMFAPDNGSDGPAGLSHAVFCTAAGDQPTFEQSQAGDTDTPTEPNTAELGANGTSGPADGAWLLVVALGVLLASIVVLTPARANSRR